MTYGYLHDRFVDHQATLGPTARPPLVPTTVTCQVCHEVGADAAWLSAHVRSAHPLAAPMLVIDGRMRSPDTMIPVRDRVVASAVQTANATSLAVSVDGGPPAHLSPAELGVRLASIDFGVAQIHLRNERADGAEVTRTFDLNFAIPRGDELEAVDAAFAEAVGLQTAAEDLDRFAARVAGLMTAIPYASALHAYLRGILLKDGRLSGLGLEFAKHRDHLSQALHEMAFYPERPLARAVAGVIRFNLNEFLSHAPSGIAELDSFAADLIALAERRQPPRNLRPIAQRGGVCPVDDSTHALLQLNRDLTDVSRRRAAVTSLLRMASSPRTTPADAAKARVLALGTADQLTDEEQRRAAAALSNDHVFADFASTVLAS